MQSFAREEALSIQPPQHRILALGCSPVLDYVHLRQAEGV